MRRCARVALYRAMRKKVAELKLELAEKEKAQKKLRETIEIKDFDLKVEKATRKASNSAEQLYRRLVKGFFPVGRNAETLRVINEVYLDT